MSRARNLLERIVGGAAPVEAPPKPGVKPTVHPGKPSVHPGKPDWPDPMRRRELRPGEKTRPKAASTGLGDHMSRTI